MTLLASPVAPMTPEEFERVPDNQSMELVDGRIVEKSVSLLSSETENHIAFRLSTFIFQVNPPIAIVLPQSMGYRCFPDDPNKIRKPDVSVILKERLAALRNPNPGFMPIVPDLAIEVVSPNDTYYEVRDKVKEYHDAGFPLVWVADPEPRTISVHPRGETPYYLSADKDISAPAVLPGFTSKVAELFPPVR